jgi:class 3 adenylate cyclase
MAENAASRRFCAQCGTPLPLPCPACGFENEPTAKFCGGCGKPVGEATAPAPAAPSPRSRTDSAERRQLTVMFCDLVGSTPLSARLDPEDLRGIMGSYHRRVAETVEGFGGFVARYMGDGVLIYFGYPQAHEDDAERAIRCALAVVEQVPQLNLAETLHTRIGIATGLVVVGGEVVEHDVVGDTPNLAARLQALAEPDTVVIAAGTHRLVGDLFEYRDLGEIELKGIAGTVPAWRVLRESAVASRFEALRGSALTPLVGRDEEIDLLMRRWARAEAGDGQVVLISGEPGIGKSRITAELEGRLHTEPHIRLRYFCSLRRSAVIAGFGAPPAAEPQSATQKGADAGGSNPSARRSGARAAGADGFRGRALGRSDLARVARPHNRALRTLPVQLIVTFRPEFQPVWTGQPQVTMLTLNRLDRRDRSALVAQIAGGKVLSDEVVDQIVDRTDGVPLFIEELTKSVLESGVPLVGIHGHLARLADGAARPFSVGAAGGADRRCDRAPVSLPTAACRLPPSRGRAASFSSPPGRL